MERWDWVALQKNNQQVTCTQPFSRFIAFEWCTMKGRKMNSEARQSKADEEMGMHYQSEGSEDAMVPRVKSAQKKEMSLSV